MRGEWAPIYPILDVEMAAARGHDLIACARGFAGLGLGVQQLRAKSLGGRTWLEWAERLRTVVPRLIINDRADIARLASAAGVHVGQTDLSPTAVRQLQAPGWERPLVGLSTHGPAQLRAALTEPVDYLAIGPIFSTVTKINPDPAVGLEGLAAARAILTQAGCELPLVAIGGIQLQHCAAVRRAGADSIAVISALWMRSDPVQAARQLLLASD